MSRTDREEYGTGDNPNPLDYVPAVPRNKDDWQGRMLDARTASIESAPWYPAAHAPPATEIPRRYSAFTVDEGGFQASVSPQKWDAYAPIQIAAGAVKEAWPAIPGLTWVEINNTGANPVLISPTQDAANNGVGKAIAAGATWTLTTQAAGWVFSALGSTIQVNTTQYLAPVSHVPPKDKEG